MDKRVFFAKVTFEYFEVDVVVPDFYCSHANQYMLDTARDVLATDPGRHLLDNQDVTYIHTGTR